MQPSAFVVFNTILLIAAIGDVRTMRIPNWLPIALSVAALLFAFPQSWSDACSRLAVFGLVSVIGVVLWTRNILGGGDLKLLAAAALWMPLAEAPLFATMLGLCGGVQSVGTVLWVAAQPKAQVRWARGWRYMPYAVSIAAAGLLWSSLLMTQAPAA